MEPWCSPCTVNPCLCGHNSLLNQSMSSRQTFSLDLKASSDGAPPLFPCLLTVDNQSCTSKNKYQSIPMSGLLSLLSPDIQPPSTLSLFFSTWAMSTRRSDAVDPVYLPRFLGTPWIHNNLRGRARSSGAGSVRVCVCEAPFLPAGRLARILHARRWLRFIPLRSNPIDPTRPFAHTVVAPETRCWTTGMRCPAGDL